ncbi:unnamed protein product [Medioppia subpectinata]|uniref:Peptidase S1 domain-containing protein n=1 Tax=Medioppia subpectinata TaxID=1979941 RepID=A0A7R9LGS7_9ACAR|nr:unnamed protein product [Medioppia subpectinata]CAG2118096.1 unnamed protein product [Medioppia subpectinata]
MSVKYTHAINDCNHLCFYVPQCVRECEQGFRRESSEPEEPQRRESAEPEAEPESHRKHSHRRESSEPEAEPEESHRRHSHRRKSPPSGDESSPSAVRVYSSAGKASRGGAGGGGSRSKSSGNKAVKSFSGMFDSISPAHCGLRYNDGRKSSLLGTVGMGRIVGGEDAEPHEFPWLVSLQFRREGKPVKHFCGGAILNQYYILTAAHCTDTLVGQEHNVIVKAGVNMWNEPNGQVAQAEKFIVHRGWDKAKQMNDISLIRLKTPLRYSVNNYGQYLANAICLPVDSMDPYGSAELAGWGQLGEDKTSPEWLQKIVMPIWDRHKCSVNYRQYMPIEEKHVCSGGTQGGQDSCMGDSGGPLVQTKGDRTYQIGVVSFGIPCAVKGLPGVYTNLIYFMDWIHDNIL